MRKFEYCLMCGRKIFHEDAMREQDPCYEINEDTLCEDCVRPYIEENCKKELSDET